MTSPYHEGEHTVQARAGVRERMEQVGSKVIANHMPEQHRAFHARLPWLFIGSMDAGGRPWASVVYGQPGFAWSPAPDTLRIGAVPIAGDPLGANLVVGSPLGMLGIEVETRRRNRMNGTVAGIDESGFDVRVAQAFGNCPKYITTRTLRWRRADKRPTVHVAHALGPAHRSFISRADTLFIASAHVPGGPGPAYGVDVSHRGGQPGFVRVEADGSLTLPDYRGNNAFNTFGNIEKDRRAGLLFVDFEAGALLQITTTAAIVWDAPEITAGAGVQRLLRLRPLELRLLRDALPFEAAQREASPHLDGIASLQELAGA